jgi:mono/diheme cytochrome c family protein
MNKRKSRLTLFVAALLVCGVYARRESSLAAQERPGPNPTGADAKLTQEQFKGQGLFLQRCSLCHLARNLKFGTPPTVGPSLKSAFKNTSADEEKDLRTFIMNGSPHMPGFRYALSQKEIEDLIAYLKVM